jgi:CelD/BcsL family acetyltransferase involved in cellulose biosynthesis
VAVFEDDRLIGVAPFFSVRTPSGIDELRFLGSRVSVRGEPLAVQGREEDVARATIEVLRDVRPRIDLLLFEGVPTLSRWPTMLCRSWSDGHEPYKHRAYPTLAPTLDLTGRTYDEWFMSRSSHFRQEVRRRRRHLEQRGAEFRLAETPEEVVDALDAFFRLHHSRWQQRGGSRVLNERVQAMLIDAALALVVDGRFRIWTITADGDIVSAHIFIAAGGEVAYWLGGFDEGWAKLGPAIQTVLKALEHAWSRGDSRMDFGAGAQEYKYSFAESQDVLESVTIAPRGPRYPVTRLQLTPRRVRESLSTRMSPDLRDRINRLRQRS